jgi:amino acid transporter
MSMMVGIGPFITIPTIVAAMGGPHAVLGWVLGAVVALADGLVWSELAAAFPGSGGTYHFYDAVFGDSRLGRLLRFLFVWQFVFSGPLEVATGAIGVAMYLAYLWPTLHVTAWEWIINVPLFGSVRWHVDLGRLFAMGVMAAITGLAYRRIEAVGRIMVVLWIGMLATVVWVIVAGALHFDRALAFDYPAEAWRLGATFANGLGEALGIAMYAYLGYYQVCYLGDEVDDPVRTLPRSILISVVVIALLYLAMNLSILGVIPWREVARSDHVVSVFMFWLYGARAAQIITLAIVWTAAAAAFAALLSYARVPYAAARSGHFFRALGTPHPRGEFPHRALLLMGGISMLACLADLETVILALLTSRILIQFVGQIATICYLRTSPELVRRMRFRMWFFPLPALVALVGWLFVFSATDRWVKAYGVGSLALGLAAFLVWERARGCDLEAEIPLSISPTPPDEGG